MDGLLPAQSYISRIRGVPLLPEEKVARVLSLEEGLLAEPAAEGRLLAATNRRILYFTRNRGYEETYLLPVEELSGVTVSATGKGSFSWARALLLGLGALVFYLVAAYWLVGRVSSPTIPGINIDAAPLLVLAALLVGGWFLASRYIHPAGGVVTLVGNNWTLPIEYPGAERTGEVGVWVNALFRCRELRRETLRQGTEGDRAGRA